MKKTMIIILAVAWAIANFTGQALAADGPQVSLGFLYGNDSVTTDESGCSGGSAYIQKSNETYVLSGLLLGVIYPWKAFDLGLEYGAGQTKDYAGAKTDLNLGRFKAGYRLWDGAQLQLIPYLGWLSLKADDSQYSGVELGIDMRYDVAAKLRLLGGFGYLPKPALKYGSNTANDTGLLDYRLKAEYLFTDRLCLGLGYQSFHYSGQYSSYTNSSNYSNGSLDGTSDFLTLGFVYRFPAPEKAAEAESSEKTEEPSSQTTAQSKPEEQSTEPVKTQATETTIATQPEKQMPETVAQPQPNEPLRFLVPIFFDFESATIRSDQQAALAQDVQSLLAANGYILIGGHADPYGEREYNIDLSRRRAQAVADYLAAHGINPVRIGIFAYGKDHPEAKGKAEDWQSDRWADIVITVEEPRMEMGIRK
ncbi:MAG TPA: hypothetical protein DDW65_03810 [Firmicutes bacterium]|jgi:peptidoglycan-associated lipoprotein|nr:hypothetical protein [Bacillota bacterium]